MCGCILLLVRRRVGIFGEVLSGLSVGWSYGKCWDLFMCFVKLRMRIMVVFSGSCMCVGCVLCL